MSTVFFPAKISFVSKKVQYLYISFDRQIRGCYSAIAKLLGWTKNNNKNRTEISKLETN